MKTDKINMIINFSILALLIYLAVGLKDLRRDFKILTQSIHKVMENEKTLSGHVITDEDFENAMKVMLLNRFEAIND